MAHRATIGFLVLSAFVVLALLGVQRQADGASQSVRQACTDRVHQWDALHSVIVKSYTPQPPPPAILRLFPQIKPIYTPGTPEFEAALKANEDRRDAVLGLLGFRPDCRAISP